MVKWTRVINGSTCFTDRMIALRESSGEGNQWLRAQRESSCFNEGALQTELVRFSKRGLRSNPVSAGIMSPFLSLSFLISKSGRINCIL